MRHWFRTHGRALLSLLSDFGGALAFVVTAIALAAAALTGTLLLLLDVFPQPFFTMLVFAMALFAAGLALHFLRDSLVPPPTPTPPPPAQTSNPYSQAVALQARHEQNKAETEERDRRLNERRAIRRIREELLDNRHVLPRVPGNLDELLSLKFLAWDRQETTLLEWDDPTPHLDASAAYRELYGLCRGRVGDTGWGDQHTYGDPPSKAEIETVETAIDKAAETLLWAAGDGQPPA